MSSDELNTILHCYPNVSFVQVNLMHTLLLLM